MEWSHYFSFFCFLLYESRRSDKFDFISCRIFGGKRGKIGKKKLEDTAKGVMGNMARYIERKKSYENTFIIECKNTSQFVNVEIICYYVDRY